MCLAKLIYVAIGESYIQLMSDLKPASLKLLIKETKSLKV